MGSYTYAVDHKGRVNIPTKFRKSLPSETEEILVVTRGLEGCLFVYPLDEWQRVEEKLRALPMTLQNTRYFVRMLTSQATMVSIDKQGRVALPKSLLDLAKIENEVLIVGTLDRFEFWNPTVYEQYLTGFGKTYEEVAESILL
ncbi:MAG: division/cell wall cluster transcriptional repressor MraZ [Candidatus Latescibacteria bacterium]|nr:division/cell wall cluster transcriptional repressor MraZ [Candidatus Latescibacterota bacterium]